MVDPHPHLRCPGDCRISRPFGASSLPEAFASAPIPLAVVTCCNPVTAVPMQLLAWRIFWNLRNSSDL